MYSKEKTGENRKNQNICQRKRKICLISYRKRGIKRQMIRKVLKRCYFLSFLNHHILEDCT